MGDITAANAVLMLSVTTIFPTPRQIQGFSVDDVYDIAAIKSVETLMGVDGVLSAGFVWVARVQEITLQVDSASNALFDIWNARQEQGLGTFAANGLITLPAITTKFQQVQGFLTGYKPAPGAGKLLKPRKYEITWQRISPAPT